MDSGQDRDELCPTRVLVWNKDLERDLRDIVTPGIGLSQYHLGKLRVLPKLDRVLSDAVSDCGPSSAPEAVRRAVEKAIQQVEAADESCTHWAEVCNRIFGFKGMKRNGPSRERWLDALDYYNDYINDRAEPVRPETNQRVWRQELLPPIVWQLLRWNQILTQAENEGGGSHIELRRETLETIWREHYKWQFSVINLLQLFCPL